jgi:hypothetical protein
MKAAPTWARSIELCGGLGKFSVFGSARSRSYAKLLVKVFGRFNISDSGECATEMWQRQFCVQGVQGG